MLVFVVVLLLIPGSIVHASTNGECLPGQVCTFPLDPKGTDCRFNEVHFFTSKGSEWRLEPNQKTSLSAFFGNFGKSAGYKFVGNYYGGCVCDTASWVNYVLRVNGIQSIADAPYHSSPVAGVPKADLVTICIGCNNGTYDLWVTNKTPSPKILKWSINDEANTVSLWVETVNTNPPVVTVYTGGSGGSTSPVVSLYSGMSSLSYPSASDSEIIKIAIIVVGVALFGLGLISRSTRGFTIALGVLILLIVLLSKVTLIGHALGFNNQVDDQGITASEEYQPRMLAYSPSENLPTPVPNQEPSVVVPPSEPVSLDGYQEIFSGVFLGSDGPNSIIRVNLSDPTVKFFASPGDGRALVCDQLSRFDLQVAINGSGFDMSSGVVQPFAMYDGRIYSNDRTPDITLFVTENNKLIFGQDGTIPEGAKYALTGFNRVVDDGHVLDRFYEGHPNHKPGYAYLKRRTTVSTDGKWLNIVLFESPVTIPEIGEYHLAAFPGTTDVFNLDGGGSTNSCIEGIGPTVTQTGRPVANIFGLYAENK